MIYTELTKKAMRIAYEKHKDQYDKSGVPYIFHPFHVAESMTDENTTAIALLHDVVEDTETTFEELETMGFGAKIIEALRLLTREEGQDYFSYIEKLSKNPLAVQVKLSDLRHNSDLSRLAVVTQKDRERVEKYNKCTDYLKKVQGKN